MKDSKKSVLSFTLIEVLIFVTILSVFFITALSVTVISLRNTQINEHKIMATKYAEELMEWLKSQKENGWKDFYDQSDGQHCFNTLVWPPSVPGNCGLTFISGTIFKRYATLTKMSGNQVNIQVTVTWSEIGNTYSVPLETIVSVWE
jgi:Tfp pilus assembly protein PilV